MGPIFNKSLNMGPSFQMFFFGGGCSQLHMTKTQKLWKVAYILRKIPKNGYPFLPKWPLKRDRVKRLEQHTLSKLNLSTPALYTIGSYEDQITIKGNLLFLKLYVCFVNHFFFQEGEGALNFGSDRNEKIATQN